MSPWHRHLRDLRAGLLLRGTRAVDAPLLRKAEICAGVLAEARQLAASNPRSPQLAGLVNRAHELLDELDESLLALDHARDRAVFAQFAEMRQGLAQLEARRAASRA